MHALTLLALITTVCAGTQHVLKSESQPPAQGPVHFDDLDEFFYTDNIIEVYNVKKESKDIQQEYMTSYGAPFLLSDQPQLPAEVNPDGWHMFVRLDTVPKTYPSFGSVNHTGLNKLMFDLGGQHVDLVFGSPSKGWWDCGLSLKDTEWHKTHSNADGYPVVADCGALKPYGRDAYSYMGRYGGGNIPRLAFQLLENKTYDHLKYHCGTFVQIVLKILRLEDPWNQDLN